MQTILVVDDNLAITRPLQAYLAKQGYRTVVADNGRNALFTARHAKPDLILLDVMMPVLDGFGFIEAFRKKSSVPIILVSARLEESDKIKGLTLGADDYVTKPIPLAELLARIEAVLRRYRGVKPVSVLRVGTLELDEASEIVKLGGSEVDLTPSEFELLHLFMRHPARVFSRAELLEYLGEGTRDASERQVDYHILNLRKKLADDPKAPRYIETVFGRGYRLRAEGA